MVRAALTVAMVLAWFGVEYRDRPEIRLATCPACGQRQRRASFLVDRESGAWFHHGGAGSDGAPCRGNIFGLIAALAGLDVQREFTRVIELGASIAGVAPDRDPAESARRRDEYQARLAANVRQTAQERAAAEERVPLLWSKLATRHPDTGEPYLAGRGIDPAELRARGDVVRYRPDGAPCVLLHSFDGRPVNVIARQIDREPKILSLDIRRTLGRHEVRGSHSTIGTLVGCVSDLDTTGGGLDVAVLVEGVTDSIAAVLAFPGCVVLGANGWYRMAEIAAAVAPRIVKARGWLLVAADDDEQGVAGASDALRVAVDAGLVLRKSVRAIELGVHKDLAEAWRAGWRWTWPDDGVASGGAS